jgi:hypothetical protein
MVLGVALTIFGAVLSLLPKGVNPLSWFGHLPGDILYKTDHTVIWIPWVSMLLVSGIVSVLFRIAQALLGSDSSR